MRDRVTILMALYNGERFLAEQLQSFTAQRWTDWDLVVGDDGSTDNSLSILSDWAAGLDGQQVTTLPGPQRGVAMNVLNMLANIEGDPAYVALSDQDDVWLAEHLTQAVTGLEDYAADLPVLMGNSTFIVDEDLSNPRPTTGFKETPSFENALVQSIAGGNTMVMNRAGWQLARDAAREAMAVGGPKTHDWWLYQLFTGTGAVMLRDHRPTLLYRQHGANQFGTNKGLRPSLARLGMALNGEMGEWFAQNSRALMASRNRLLPEKADVLDQFRMLSDHNMLGRWQHWQALGFHRQDRVGQLVLNLAVLLGRI